ncbi:MAG: hypothetical protein RL308_2409 [Bacteroidota bacterium]|jgi:hypothetical protein
MRIVACFIALFFSNLLSAQIETDGEWILSSSSSTEEFYVLDKLIKDDIRESNDYFSKYHPDSDKYVVKVWVREDFLKPIDKIKNKFIDYRISLMEFDLFKTQVRTIEIISYDKTGSVLNHVEFNSYESDWSNLIPNSVGYGLLETTRQIIEEIQVVDDIILLFKSNNKIKIANMISYPLYREYPIPEIKNTQEMLARFEEVFDEHFISKLAKSNANDWSRVGWRGVMFGNGELWLDDDGKLRAVNYQTPFEENRLETIILRDKNIIHESIKSFIEPILVGVTNDYRFRIDLMKEQENIDDIAFRLAVWKINERMCDKPFTILLGTEYHGSEQISFYEFKNGEMRYTYDEIYFAINKDDQEIISQDVTILSPEFLEKERGEIEKEIRERKKQIEFTNLSINGDAFVTENKLKKGLIEYQKAYKLYSDNTVLNNKINEIKANIKRIESLQKHRNEVYLEILKLKTELINDSTTTMNLLEIKKTISRSYALCISSFVDSIDLNLKTYNSKITPTDEEALFWSDADQESLNIIDSLSREMQKIFRFKKVVDHLICLGEKKNLKNLTDSVIISEIIAEILKDESFLSIDCIKAK